LVGFFLGGLVVLGSQQGWWLAPLVGGLSDKILLLGATALTGVVDNAALTYLGSLIPDTSESFRYHLVAGAVAGGGLTLIANAPNPAGASILRERFPDSVIAPGRLLVWAFPPTLVALIAFWI
ncbi:MAG TPA: putative Na+/H+ antiporter, partial [Fibrobacteria bacterium]|nr:putative Na+/H+ antiporter [Fibrobacteria bacterium]